MGKILYLDHQATTPVDTRVLEAMSEYWQNKFGNPHSNSHIIGWNAEKAVNKAREQVATAIGSVGDEIVFTSGATESNNLAVFAMCQLSEDDQTRRQILVSPIEHKCVLNSINFWGEKLGYDVVYMQVDSVGSVDIEWLEKALEIPTLFCSIGLVNNEIGTIQPLEEISEILRAKGVFLHSDCAQAPKTLLCDKIADLVDMASFSGHKIGGPPGIGALYVTSGLQEKFISLIQGGGQQLGFRSGTLPLPLCVGLGEAFELVNGLDFWADFYETKKLRDYFYEQLKNSGLNVTLNGPPLENRHVGNLNVAFNGIKALDLLFSVQPLIAASTGSACASGEIEPSHVLMSLGYPIQRAESSVRFSFSKINSFSEIDEAVGLLTRKIDLLQNDSVFDL